jgi:DNA (cytosine-5)-methyltransferase 1
VEAAELMELYPKGHVKILVGCAPCQPYSIYNRKRQDRERKWELLFNFSLLISEIEPDIISMENVPNLTTFRNGKIYQNCLKALEDNKYEVSAFPDVFCSDYGIPQRVSTQIWQP